MSSFWASFGKHLKGCGRNATIFLAALAGLFALLLLGGIVATIVRTDAFKIFFPAALPGLGLLAAAWLVRVVRRALKTRGLGSPHRPLSSDELRVARSKLLSGRHPKSV